MATSEISVVCTLEGTGVIDAVATVLSLAQEAIDYMPESMAHERSQMKDRLEKCAEVIIKSVSVDGKSK